MLDELRVVGDHHVFNTMVRNTVKLGEAPLVGRPITSYASGTSAARTYRELAREVVDLARTDFRAAAARRLSEDSELSPAIVSLLTPDSPTRSVGVRIVPIDRIDPNPQQPRVVFEEDALEELAASIREHGVLQPILVRPIGPNQYQIVAGERRWRASRLAGLASIPALIEEIDDDTALEISIIENLQREDLTPLDEAAMYDRMVHEHGYSIRKLAEKLGKDKGYLENRLRLAGRAARDPRAGVLAQRQPVACLRTDEGRGPEEASAADRPGRARRADPHQASREDRWPGAPGAARRPRTTAEVDVLIVETVEVEFEAEPTRASRRRATGRPSRSPMTRSSTPSST